MCVHASLYPCVCGCVRSRYSASHGCLSNLPRRICRTGAVRDQLKMVLSVTDSLAEWSKAVDSSSTIFGCVGSNTTAIICQKKLRAAGPAQAPLSATLLDSVHGAGAHVCTRALAEAPANSRISCFASSLYGASNEQSSTWYGQN